MRPDRRPPARPLCRRAVSRWGGGGGRGAARSWTASVRDASSVSRRARAPSPSLDRGQDRAVRGQGVRRPALGAGGEQLQLGELGLHLDLLQGEPHGLGGGGDLDVLAARRSAAGPRPGCATAKAVTVPAQPGQSFADARCGGQPGGGAGHGGVDTRRASRRSVEPSSAERCRDSSVSAGSDTRTKLPPPRPRRVSTSPRRRRSASASRRVTTATRSDVASSASGGSCSPSPIRPSAIAPPSRRTTASDRTAPSSSGAKTAADRRPRRRACRRHHHLVVGLTRSLEVWFHRFTDTVSCVTSSTAAAWRKRP